MKKEYLKPKVMLKNKYADCFFQLHIEGKATKWYYLNCGLNEDRLICFWWDDEDKKFRLSTSNKSDLKEYLPHVSVVKLDRPPNLEFGKIFRNLK
jgi:hypothetical protein